MAGVDDLIVHLRRLEEAYGADMLLPRGAPWSPPARPEPAPAPAETSPSPGTRTAESGATTTAARSHGHRESRDRTAAGTANPQPVVRRPGTRAGAASAADAPVRPAATTPPAAPTDPAATLAALAGEVAVCERCQLCQTRNLTVFGEGNARADVLFVGEAPGANEDRQGRPFVGPAGELLDRIISNAMGLQRSDVYIANVNKCRPPGNRDPEPEEVAACLPFLRKQIEAIAPKVIVTLGRIAAHNLLGTTLPMRALRGRDLERDGVPVVATWHPAYLLRQPSAKRETWEDIKRVNRLLGRPEVPPGPASPRS